MIKCTMHQFMISFYITESLPQSQTTDRLMKTSDFPWQEYKRHYCWNVPVIHFKIHAKWHTNYK